MVLIIMKLFANKFRYHINLFFLTIVDECLGEQFHELNQWNRQEEWTVLGWCYWDIQPDTPKHRKRNMKQTKDRWHKINKWTEIFSIVIAWCLWRVREHMFQLLIDRIYSVCVVCMKDETILIRYLFIYLESVFFLYLYGVNILSIYYYYEYAYLLI